MVNDKSKSGEPFSRVYITSFGLKLAVPASDAAFYEFLHIIRRNGWVSEAAFRFFEANFIFNGYDIVA